MKKTDSISFAITLFSALLLVFIFSGAVSAAGIIAGKIHRMEGAVIVVRDGRTLNGRADLEIYADDEIKTGPHSIVEFIMQDGSSLHMGPESRLELSKYEFSLGKDKPSFLARMTKGIFVYISGAISKVHPGAVQFETPDATIGIRGTKLVLKIDDLTIEKEMETETLAGCQETTVVLFRDPDGHVGTVSVSNDKGKEEVNQEFYAINVKCGSAPSKPVYMGQEDLKKIIPAGLHSIVFENYRPPLPYTPADNPFTTPLRPVTPPEKPQTFSVTAPQ